MLKEIEDSVGQARGGMSAEVQQQITDLAAVANTLGIESSETSSFLLEMSRVGLSQSALDCRKFALRKEKILIQRKLRYAISSTEILKGELQRVRQESAKQSQNTEEWLSEMQNLKEREKKLRETQVKTDDDLSDAGYCADLSHQSLEALVADKKALESRVRPVLDTLASYHNLPADSERAQQLLIRKQEELESLLLQFNKKLAEAL